jgi:hypothetical protein
MSKHLCPVLGALWALLVLPATSLAASKDQKATRAYVLASYSLIRAARASIPAAEAEVATLNQQIGAECPHAAPESPQNNESEQLADEVAGALWSIVYHLDAPAISRFTSIVRPLRWSNHEITGTAERYVKSLRQLTALTMPSLCTDVRAWVASGFHTVPSSTVTFDKYFSSIEATPISPKLLMPYEGKAEQQLAARTAHLEVLLGHAESTIGFDDWSSVLETVGVNQ